MPAALSRPVRAFVFDLDGTLIDSKLDLVHSVNAMLRQTSRPELPVDLVASYVGHGAPRLIASVLGPHSSESDRKLGLELFLSHYRDHCLDFTRPYPGVLEGLQSLALLPLSVLTNKPLDLSLRILDGLGLSKFFRSAYGGDSFSTKKPDPAGVLRILLELGVPPAESAMVGDSDVDVQTARNASMHAVAVSYGFGKYDRLANPADIYVDRLDDLPRLVSV